DLDGQCSIIELKGSVEGLHLSFLDAIKGTTVFLNFLFDNKTFDILIVWFALFIMLH
ncbi:hypothetical protein ACJX0J_028660, partial [Zea mays]